MSDPCSGNCGKTNEACDSAGLARIPVWTGLLLVLVLCAGSLGREVWTPDEPREAALALAMSRSGQWVIPELAGQAFVEKPPLYYVVGAFFIRAFGEEFDPTTALRIAGILWGLANLAVVFMLAARLLGRRRAMGVVCVLGVMPGFMHISHWLAVDQALMFFVAAAIWLLAEACCAARPWALPAAAAAAAAAFLVKGALGPAIIALGWLGLVFARSENARHNSLRYSRGAWALMYVLALMIFVVLTGAWIVRFYIQAGPDLFHEWFWRNHVGRFLGQTPDLGHQNGLFYYFGVVPVYMLQWLPMFLLGIVVLLRECRKGGWKQVERRLPIIWGIGGLLLLTLSGTKREIYLAVVLPAFAMFAEAGLQHAVASAWIRNWQRVWNALCIALLAVLAVFVLFAPLWVEYIAGFVLLANWHLFLFLIALCLLLGVVIVRMSAISGLARQTALTALLAIALFQVVPAAGDVTKNYEPAFQGLLAEIAGKHGLQPATWGLDETSRAGFYYFGNGAAWHALTNTDELTSVLEGRHQLYNAVISYRKTDKTEPIESLVQCEIETIAVRNMGRNRELSLSVPKSAQSRKDP